MYIYPNIGNPIRGDKMTKNKKEVIKDTAPRREKCGDCYYNGNCKIALSKCMFIKKKRK